MTYEPCPICDFVLWIPLGAVGPCDVGLYDDARFPGRLIVALREHHEHFDEMPPGLAAHLMSAVRLLSCRLRKRLPCDRVNIAILGNAEPHVHAHFVPRVSTQEPAPRRSPWSDPRPCTPLSVTERCRLASDLPDLLDLDPF